MCVCTYTSVLEIASSNWEFAFVWINCLISYMKNSILTVRLIISQEQS